MAGFYKGHYAGLAWRVRAASTGQARGPSSAFSAVKPDVTVAYRWNMGLREMARTFCVVRGHRVAVACGPMIVEW